MPSGNRWQGSHRRRGRDPDDPAGEHGLQDSRPRHVLEGDGSAMWSVAVSRNGTSLGAVTMDGTAHLWDIGTAVEVCRLRVDGHLSACSFHPYGHRVVLGGSAGLYACEISPDAVDDR
ncbi:hypothetical protein [Streptomyces mirabilis]|uniref:hypothetical protein n=1 Tax=Streptomyces mirabilis TaxID=68239 RepID=UPI0036DDA451